MAAKDRIGRILETQELLKRCCRAGRKENCTQPPCPVNPEAWTLDELEAIRQVKIKKRIAEL